LYSLNVFEDFNSNKIQNLIHYDAIYRIVKTYPLCFIEKSKYTRY